MTFDITSFTMPHMLLELLGSTPSARLTRGDPGEVREFLAVAVIDSVPMSEKAYNQILGKDPEGARLGYDPFATWLSDRSARYRVYCSIEGTSDGSKFAQLQQNVHSFIPRCADEKSLQALSTLYAHCFTKKHFTGNQDTYVAQGDVLRISCMFDSKGKIMLTKCDIEDIVKKSSSVDRTLCSIASSIKDLFE